jgi:hypothetical protein
VGRRSGMQMLCVMLVIVLIISVTKMLPPCTPLDTSGDSTSPSLYQASN